MSADLRAGLRILIAWGWRAFSQSQTISPQDALAVEKALRWLEEKVKE